MDDYCGTGNKMGFHWSEKNEKFHRLATFNEEKHSADGTECAGTCVSDCFQCHLQTPFLLFNNG